MGRNKQILTPRQRAERAERKREKTRQRKLRFKSRQKYSVDDPNYQPILQKHEDLSHLSEEEKQERLREYHRQRYLRLKYGQEEEISQHPQEEQHPPMAAGIPPQVEHGFGLLATMPHACLLPAVDFGEEPPNVPIEASQMHTAIQNYTAPAMAMPIERGFGMYDTMGYGLGMGFGIGRLMETVNQQHQMIEEKDKENKALKAQVEELQKTSFPVPDILSGCNVGLKSDLFLQSSLKCLTEEVWACGVQNSVPYNHLEDCKKDPNLVWFVRRSEDNLHPLSIFAFAFAGRTTGSRSTSLGDQVVIKLMWTHIDHRGQNHVSRLIEAALPFIKSGSLIQSGPNEYEAGTHFYIKRKFKKQVGSANKGSTWAISVEKLQEVIESHCRKTAAKGTDDFSVTIVRVPETKK